MQVGVTPQSADLGFTDALRPGVGYNVGGPSGDCAVSMTGNSLVVTVADGTIWVQDINGTHTNITNSLLRQVLTSPTTVTLASNGSSNPRVDIIVARVGGNWGEAPSIAIIQGTATGNANARNLIGAGGLTAGDVPLCVITVPANANPPAFGARVSTTAVEDARQFASDLTPPGIEKHHAGSTPPLGYKLEDGSVYGTVANGPWNNLVTEIGSIWGGAGQVPDSRSRTRMAAGSGSGLTARTLGQNVGGETHHHSLTSITIGSHSHSVALGVNGCTAAVASHTHSVPAHSHALGNEGGAKVQAGPYSTTGLLITTGSLCNTTFTDSTHNPFTLPSGGNNGNIGSSKGQLQGVSLYGATSSDGATTTGSATPQLSGVTGTASGGSASGNTDAATTVSPAIVSNAIIKY